jgi:type II secretory pathway component PulF
MVTPGQLSRRAALFEQLAAMIAAGLPLSRAMEMAGRSRSVGIPRAVIQDIISHLNDGHTFTDAMQLASGQKRGMDVSLKRLNREYWLPEFDIALLSAGEESGRLDATFRLLARYYESRAKIIRDTISSLAITAITLHVFLVIFPLPFFVAFVLGIFNNQYAQCEPFIIEKVLVFGFLWGSIWFLTFACQGNRGERWRSAVESLFNGVPMLRSAVKYLALARLSMALDSLLNSGVRVVRAWELAAAACGSARLKREIMAWTPHLEEGTTPAEMVAQISYFPDMFTQLYQSGEISGKVDETLTRLHAYYEEEGFRKLHVFCRILNMVIYFTIALSVAAFIIHFWTGYFNSVFNPG